VVFTAHFLDETAVDGPGLDGASAIVKRGADGRQTNTLGIQVAGDEVVFKVNGEEVTRSQADFSVFMGNSRGPAPVMSCVLDSIVEGEYGEISPVYRSMAS
jgi:hypothetical protein